MPRIKKVKPTALERYLNRIELEKKVCKQEVYNLCLSKNRYSSWKKDVGTKSYMKRLLFLCDRQINELNYLERAKTIVEHFANDLGLELCGCYPKRYLEIKLAFKRNNLTNNEVFDKISKSCTMSERISDLKVSNWQNKIFIVLSLSKKVS